MLPFPVSLIPLNIMEHYIFVDLTFVCNGLVTLCCRLYVKYLRSIAEKTDFGRLIGPSVVRLVDEAINLSGSSSNFNGKMSSEIWDALERILEVLKILI